MLKAGVGFSILPAAVTHSRCWRPSLASVHANFWDELLKKYQKEEWPREWASSCFLQRSPSGLLYGAFDPHPRLLGRRLPDNAALLCLFNNPNLP